MFNNFVPIAQLALTNARKEALFYKRPMVEPEHLLLGLLALQKGFVRDLMEEREANPGDFRVLVERKYSQEGESKALREPGFSQDTLDVINRAMRSALENGHKFICDGHLLLGLALREGSLEQEYLSSLELPAETIEKRLAEHLGNEGGDPGDLASRVKVEVIPIDFKKLSPQEQRFFQQMRRRGLRGGEASQEDPFSHMEMGGEMLDPAQVMGQFGVDLTALAREGKFDPLVGREKEIERLAVILCRRRKNNPVLLGEAGVGKTAIVEGLAARIVKGEVPEPLKNKRIFALDLSRLLAGTSYRGQFEEKVLQLLDALKRDGHTIVFVDEVHTMLGAGASKESPNDAANMLKPALARGEINIIGATTRDEYRRYVEKDTALERRFQPVPVEAPSAAETLSILRGLKAHYEGFHHVTYGEETLQAIVQLSARYIQDRHFPDKAIDVLDEAGARVQLQQRDRNQEAPLPVTPHDAALVVASWANVPAETLEESERKKLMRMEAELHKTIIGQEEAISAISRALRRARANLRDPRRPIGSFLALGPTGVGKSLLARSLAKFLFDDEEALITVDMSEYMEKFNVTRLFGSPPGYVGHEDGGQLTEKVRQRPFSVILFDEIEKAHPEVLHTLLQVLENGRMTDNSGRAVDFRNTVIILTSNLGAREFLEGHSLGFGEEGDRSGSEALKQQLLEKARKTLRPEFVNRLDDLLIFRRLTKEELARIVELETAKVAERLKEKNIVLKLSPAAKTKLAALGNTDRYGAREIRRVVERELEDRLAEAILGGLIPEASCVTVKVREGEFVFETATLPADMPAKA